MNLTDTECKKWYAVYTRSHFERKVKKILLRKEITTFLPLRKGKIRIAGSYRFSDVPLFRSYLFINILLNSEDYNKVLATTGVSSIVKKGKNPCSISDETIESLKKLVEKMNDEINVITEIKRGERVTIIKGPLIGTVGEMVKVDNKKCLFVVNVDILGRGVEISIPPECVSKI
ncbi:UpxY family transcription antiterminator [candidate division WOR-3 bacterium]|nr:UpxY family transcription antiterminator [candidate division WOR-3 bacterium]